MSISEKIKNFFSDPNLPSEELDAETFASVIPDHHRTTGLVDGEVESEIISCSDSTYLVSAAARICVGIDPVVDYEKRLKHISRVVGRGHESTLEHTNIILILHFNKSMYEEFVYFASAMHYLNWKVKTINDTVHVLIGGSIRGYKNAIRFCNNGFYNPFINEIKNCLYSCTESVFYEDLIEDGVMNVEAFVKTADDLKKATYTTTSVGGDKPGEGDVYCEGVEGAHNKIEKETVEVLTTEHRKLGPIYNHIKYYGFDLQDCMDVAVVTVIFKNISRPISMQINRHRNGISQESQRYVDYSKKGFIDPMKFIDEDHQNKTYQVNILGQVINKTSADIGQELCKVYEQLTAQGMLKQDARSFLPSNVCTKEMMTFTYRNLFHFFVMRQDKAAQNEVRYIANQLHEAIDEYDQFCKEHNDELMVLESMPVYISEQRAAEEVNDMIDEVEGEDSNYGEDIKPIG